MVVVLMVLFRGLIPTDISGNSPDEKYSHSTTNNLVFAETEKHIFSHMMGGGIIPAATATQNEEIIYLDANKAADHPGFAFQGEFSGRLALEPGEDKTDVGLQIAVYRDLPFRATLLIGGLPGEKPEPLTQEDAFELQNSFENHVLRFFSDELPFYLQYVHGRFLIMDDKKNSLGYLERVCRKSPTLGMKPPENALVLFDGTNLDHWDNNTKMTPYGLLKEGARTTAKFGDIRVHIEAKLSFMPDKWGGGRANSGIFLNEMYEIQITDEFSRLPRISGNGSIYDVSAPIFNMTFPPLTWQTYDIYFRAPRFNQVGEKTENARMTVYVNGILVQDDVEIERGTGSAADRKEVPKGRLYLQDHNDPVRFRNIWLIDGEITPPESWRMQPD